MTKEISTAQAKQPNNTTLALDRTILANERTYAAWIRTGFAALATGLGVERFMLNTIPLWSIHLIATLLLLFSAASFLLAGWRYHHLRIKLDNIDVDMVPMPVIRMISLTLAACSLIAIVVLLKIAG
ncbi:MAG: hypothetical protein DSY57_06725 [Desulfobulbus sp.]|nr:MAG: hypothetical protein DSY57_06725 [Desulfobulbus sp.]